MRNSSNFSQQLREFSDYRALKTAQHFLFFALLMLTLYVGYLGVSLIPFYLSVILVLLPNLLSSVFPQPKAPIASLPMVQRQLRYTKQKHTSTKITLYFTLALLLLWNIRVLQSPQLSLLLKYTPTILIITTLVIYTIGQYYYFTKFHRHMMQNEIHKIH